MTKPMIRQLATYQVRPAADPTRFTHVFVFRDADAEVKHSQSAAVKTFSGILYPECLAPVRFVDFELIATNQPVGQV